MNTVSESRLAPARTLAFGARYSAVLQRLAWLALSFVLVFGTWEIAGRIPISLTFPTFTATAAALVRMIADGSLPNAYAITLQPLGIGLALCSVAGVACGIAMGLSRRFEWLALPLLIVLQAAPMAAIIPMLTYLYGIGLTSKVLAVVILAVPVIVMNSYKGIRNTSPSLIEMCRSFQGTRMQEIVKIMLPFAGAMIFTGLRLGVAMGFIGIVIAELLITPTGIGDLITYHRSVADFPEMFATIASIIAVSALTIAGLGAVERRLFRHLNAAESA
jgi:ABC-type nitrate/sulfonate/bicarbonate transport system permease component